MTTAETATELLTIPEVAKTLRLSRSTVERLIARGRLPAVRPSGVMRVRRSDLTAFITSLPTTEVEPDENPDEGAA